MIPTYKLLLVYKGVDIYFSEDSKIYIVSKLSEDKSSYLFKKEYKTLKSCKSYIDNYLK